jgi:hypothetical protein
VTHWARMRCVASSLGLWSASIPWAIVQTGLAPLCPLFWQCGSRRRHGCGRAMGLDYLSRRHTTWQWASRPSKSSITSKVLGTVIVPSMRRCAPVEERLCTTQGTEEKRRLKAMVADLRTRGRWTLRSFWGNQLGCNWDHSWAWAGLVGDHGTLLDGACGRPRCVHALSHVASKTRVFSGSFERLGSRIVAVPGAGNGRGGPA